ncbi:hypothetical protein H072_4770 [Dactylellina haptotyla CBS 200.50]|uniref:BHLH domain-containing protein n=1 Tax=Dactylellina haptotyla (strain CBS 200.50) TaxID=1284197 RepID=S8C1B4_DACHA|nr:hypothetical protein H072_4770 [Dactylellina haptotyla CBS 200.50]
MSGGNQWEPRDGAHAGGSDGGSSPMAVEKQTLPSISNLTNSVPPLVPSPGSSGYSPSQSSVKTDTRDSGNWSMTTASNHSSFSSPMNLSAMTQDKPNSTAGRGSMLNPDSQRDSQSLNPPYGPPQSGRHNSHSPTAVASRLSNLSTTSLHSTTRPPPNVLTSPYGVDTSPSNSRRSSFDTRLSALQLNSAQGTPAASQVSLVSQLQRERSGGFGQGSPAPSIMEGGQHPYTPVSPSGHYPTPSVSSAGSGPRSSFGSSTWSNNLPPTSHASAAERPGARVAPPIIGSSRYPYPHPNAPSPTKGFPYAFPDPDAAGPTAPNSREGLSGTTGHTQIGGPGQAGRPYGYHQESSAPQHSQTSLYSQASNSTTASSHHAHPTFNQGSYQELHHHSLQRGPSSVGSPSPATPYSRTPELRISHKLAERKRRKEMKELFDELRDALPAERGGKSSKWEVLTKSIEYLNQIRHQQTALSDANHSLTSENQNLTSANDNLNRELERLRLELARARTGPPPNNDSHYAPTSNGDNYPPQHGQHYGGSHQPHQGYQPSQSRPPNSDGNQMQGIERSNY